MAGSNHYEFKLDGRRHRGSTGTANKQAGPQRGTQPTASDYKKSYNQILEGEAHEQKRKTVQQAADEFLMDYRTKHRSPTYAEYALGLATC